MFKRTFSVLALSLASMAATTYCYAEVGPDTSANGFNTYLLTTRGATVRAIGVLVVTGGLDSNDADWESDQMYWFWFEDSQALRDDDREITGDPADFDFSSDCPSGASSYTGWRDTIEDVRGFILYPMEGVGVSSSVSTEAPSLGSCTPDVATLVTENNELTEGDPASHSVFTRTLHTYAYSLRLEASEGDARTEIGSATWFQETSPDPDRSTLMWLLNDEATSYLNSSDTVLDSSKYYSLTFLPVDDSVVTDVDYKSDDIEVPE